MLPLVYDATSEVADFVNQIFEERNLKGQFERWRSLKIFGSLEQLRCEMSLRYPSTESFFLNTSDHKKIHCYWIKSVPQVEPDEEDEVLSDD